MIADDLTILFITDDPNSDLWTGFFKLLKKYWPEPIPSIIVTSKHKKYAYEGLEIKHIPENDDSWGRRLKRAVEMVKTPYSILFLDDSWIRSPVDATVLNDCIHRMKIDKKIACFNFSAPSYHADNKLDDAFIRVKHFSQYKANMQVGLWDNKYLLKLLRVYETPWDFEVCGTFRTFFTNKKFYFVKRKMLPFVFDYDYGFLLIRGKVKKEFGDYYKENEGIDLYKTRDVFLPESDSRKKVNKFKLLFKCLISVVKTK